MTSDFDITNFGTIYAAITGTAGLGLSLYLAYLDRSRIEVKFKKNWRSTDPRAQGDIIVIEAINHGRRPVKIKMAYVRCLSGMSYITADSMANFYGQDMTLTEENPSAIFTGEQKLIPVATLWYAAVNDARGKEYRKYIAPLHQRIWWSMKRLFPDKTK